MGILEMLSAVLGGQISENTGSTLKRECKQAVHGIVTSPLARCLFTANSIMADHIYGLVQEHKRLHDDKQKPADYDCKAFRANIARLCARKQVLHNLLWQAITEEHPQVAANNACICEGWHLVDEDGEWNDIVPVPDKSNIANNYVARVTSIVCGKSYSVKGEDLEPVAIGEEIIGSLNDERVQTFRSLIDEIMDELGKQLSVDTLGSDSKTIGNMTINEVNRLRVLAMHFKKLSDITSSLFWCGVRDTIPAAADLPSIGIRRAWEVVKCVPDKDDEEIEMVMTSTGPDFAMKAPIPGNMLKLFMERHGR